MIHQIIPKTMNYIQGGKKKQTGEMEDEAAGKQITEFNCRT